MTNYQPGEIVLIFVPYTGGGGGKTRPALVIADTGDADVLVARITTQPASSAHDVTLTDWKGAGLLAPPIVRAHKLATLEKALVQKLLGKLTASDHKQVGAALHGLVAGW
jgi:mRNA interferase MazF